MLIRLEVESRGAKGGPRFWEVSVCERTLRTRFGRMGGNGRDGVTEVFDTHDEALNDAQRRVRKKLSEGFHRESVFEEPGPTDSALELEIAADPEDHESYHVYADWLLHHDNPRGELINVQSALQRDPDDASLRQRERELLSEYPGLGLPPRLTRLLRRKRKKNTSPLGYCDVEWRDGFLRSARIGHDGETPNFTLRDVLIELLSHPSSRFLTRLELGAMHRGDAHDYAPVVETLGALEPRCLRALTIGALAPEHCDVHFCSVGPLGRLESVATGLRFLRVKARSLSLDLALSDVNCPLVEELELHTPDPGSWIDGLLAAHWPSLRRLRLEGCAQSAKALDTLLRHGAGLMHQLDTLEIVDGDLDEDDVPILSKLSTAALNRLILDGNRLSASAGNALQSVAATVEIENQRAPSHSGPDITREMVARIAPDSRSLTASRKLVGDTPWVLRGWDEAGAALWGTCRGSQGTYDVWVELPGLQSQCTCPSRKYPCKHALGLLLAGSEGSLAAREAPEGHERRAREGGSYYDAVWE